MIPGIAKSMQKALGQHALDNRVNLILRYILSEAALHLSQEREICLGEIFQTAIFHRHFS